MFDYEFSRLDEPIRGKADSVYMEATKGPLGIYTGYADYAGMLRSPLSAVRVTLNAVDTYYLAEGGAFVIKDGTLNVISPSFRKCKDRQEAVGLLSKSGYNLLL